MWKKIKRSIAKKLFAKEFVELEVARLSAKMLEDEYTGVTIADAVREQMGNYTYDEVFANLFASIPPERMVNFLEEAKTIQEGEVFQHLVKHIVAQQVDYIVNEAESLEHVNFGRATLNGVELMDQALGSLVIEYEQRREAGDDNFDKHSAT